MGPPAFLSVDNFQLCLDNRNVSSSSHVEWCMPENKPEKCSNGSWTKLKNVFTGSACPPIKVALNAGMYYLFGLKRKINYIFFIVYGC